MRALVAGGAGFIGVHLVKELVARGDEVVVWDSFVTGWTPDIIAKFVGKPVAIRRVDVRQPVIPDIGWLDAVINLACPASPAHYQRDRVRTLMTNVVGTHQLLELAKRKQAIFLQASTSEVYGDPLVHPQHESYAGNVCPIGPRACYDEGKRAAEALCFDYLRDHGVDVRVVRIFNTYGPMMQIDDGRVVAQFVQQALKGQPLTVYGDGLQTRSPCYIDDLVRGLLRMLAVRYAGPVNLGNPEEMTVLEIAKTVQQQVFELTGRTSLIVFEPLPGDDPRRRRPEISLARGVLPWQPHISFEEGLRRTIAYFAEPPLCA